MASINPSDPDCGICFEPLVGQSLSGHAVSVQTTNQLVSHFYHTTCLRQYQATNPGASCPACRGLMADCSVEVLSPSSKTDSSSNLQQISIPFTRQPSPAPQQSVSRSSAQALQSSAYSFFQNIDYTTIPTQLSEEALVEQLIKFIKKGDSDNFEKTFREDLHLTEENRFYLLHIAVTQHLCYTPSDSSIEIMNLILNHDRSNFHHDRESSRDTIKTLINFAIKRYDYSIANTLLDHYSADFCLNHAIDICKDLVETVISQAPHKHANLLYTIIGKIRVLIHLNGSEPKDYDILARACCNALSLLLKETVLPEDLIEDAVCLAAKFGDAALMHDLLKKCPRPLTEEERALALSRTTDPEMIKMLQPPTSCSIM